MKNNKIKKIIATTSIIGATMFPTLLAVSAKQNNESIKNVLSDETYLTLKGKKNIEIQIKNKISKLKLQSLISSTGIKNGTVARFYEDKKGNTWLFSPMQGIKLKKHGTSKWIPINNENSNNLTKTANNGLFFEDTEGNIYVQGKNSPLQVKTFNNDYFTNFNDTLVKSSGKKAKIVENGQGDIFYFSKDLPIQKKTKNSTFWQWQTPELNNSLVKDGEDGILLKDKKNIIWSGGNNNSSIQYLLPGSTKWKSAQFKVNDKMEYLKVNKPTIFEDSKGTIWLTGVNVDALYKKTSDKNYFEKSESANFKEGFSTWFYESKDHILYVKDYIRPIQTLDLNQKDSSWETIPLSEAEFNKDNLHSIAQFWEDDASNLYTIAFDPTVSSPVGTLKSYPYLYKKDKNSKKWIKQTQKDNNIDLSLNYSGKPASTNKITGSGDFYTDPEGNIFFTKTSVPMFIRLHNADKWIAAYDLETDSVNDWVEKTKNLPAGIGKLKLSGGNLYITKNNQVFVGEVGQKLKQRVNDKLVDVTGITATVTTGSKFLETTNGSLYFMVGNHIFTKEENSKVWKEDTSAGLLLKNTAENGMIMEDKNHNMWATSKDSKLIFKSFKKGTWEFADKSNLVTDGSKGIIFQDKVGNIYVAGNGTELQVLDHGVVKDEKGDNFKWETLEYQSRKNTPNNLNIKIDNGENLKIVEGPGHIVYFFANGKPLLFRHGEKPLTEVLYEENNQLKTVNNTGNGFLFKNSSGYVWAAGYNGAFPTNLKRISPVAINDPWKNNFNYISQTKVLNVVDSNNKIKIKMYEDSKGGTYVFNLKSKFIYYMKNGEVEFNEVKSNNSSLKISSNSANFIEDVDGEQYIIDGSTKVYNIPSKFNQGTKPNDLNSIYDSYDDKFNFDLNDMKITTNNSSIVVDGYKQKPSEVFLKFKRPGSSFYEIMPVDGEINNIVDGTYTFKWSISDNFKFTKGTDIFNEMKVKIVENPSEINFLPILQASNDGGNSFIKASFEVPNGAQLLYSTDGWKTSKVMQPNVDNPAREGSKVEFKWDLLDKTNSLWMNSLIQKEVPNLIIFDVKDYNVARATSIYASVIGTLAFLGTVSFGFFIYNKKKGKVTKK